MFADIQIDYLSFEYFDNRSQISFFGEREKNIYNNVVDIRMMYLYRQTHSKGKYNFDQNGFNWISNTIKYYGYGRSPSSLYGLILHPNQFDDGVIFYPVKVPR